MQLPKYIDNKKILAAIFLVLLTGVFLAGRYQYQAWRGWQYFGEVRSVTKNRIVITDREILERTIFFTPDTSILEGAAKVSLPKPGDRVIVITKNDEDGKEVAAVIRIFDKVDLTIQELPHA